MNCKSCEKLRAEIRELREELDEWERHDGGHDDGGVALIAQCLKSWPQPSRLILELMQASNRVVSKSFLVEALGYNGMGRDHDRRGTDEDRWLKVVVTKARRALEVVGIFDAIANVRGVGYIMPKQKAEEIRKVVGL